MKNIYNELLISPPKKEGLEKLLAEYVANTGELAKNDWGQNTLKLNGCT